MRPIRVVSLFSGCGAAELALQRASEQTGIPVEVVMAVDSWAVAARVRDANLPGVRTTVADVKTMTRADLPEHDLVIGGPPCQSHSTAGPKDCRCNVGGLASPRCCLADFLRLADGSAWLMENVRSRLVNAPWSEQFCALDFGDVTTRKRWFYSDHLLHVHKTPGPRRFWHIKEQPGRVGMRGHGSEITEVRDEEPLGSLTASSHHGIIRTGQSRPTRDDEPLGTLTAGKGGSSGFLLVVGDDGELRSPTVLEMQRSHSLPELWRWAGATKTQRGLLIANSWCVGMGTAVCAAMLRAVAATMERAA